MAGKDRQLSDIHFAEVNPFSHLELFAAILTTFHIIGISSLQVSNPAFFKAICAIVSII